MPLGKRFALTLLEHPGGAPGAAGATEAVESPFTLTEANRGRGGDWEIIANTIEK